MKYGYMPNSNADLFDEIVFAKENFDFFEFTLEEKLSKYNLKYIQRLKKALKNIGVYGHVHWRIKLYNKDKRAIKKAIKSIKIFKQLGAKKITIHPSWTKEISEEKLIENNLYSLKIINNFCQKHKLKLMIENIQRNPFNHAKNLSNFVQKIKGSKITFDTGHAMKVSRLEFSKFLDLKNRIEHIHLHDCVNGIDHLEFKDKNKLKKMVSRIKKSGYNKSINLEVFSILKKKKRVDLSSKRRREVLVSYLEILREL